MAQQTMMQMRSIIIPPRVTITAKYTASFLPICNKFVLDVHPVPCSVVVRMVVLVLLVEHFSDSEEQNMNI